MKINLNSLVGLGNLLETVITPLNQNNAIYYNINSKNNEKDQEMFLVSTNKEQKIIESIDNFLEETNVNEFFQFNNDNILLNKNIKMEDQKFIKILAKKINHNEISKYQIIEKLNEKVSNYNLFDKNIDYLQEMGIIFKEYNKLNEKLNKFDDYFPNEFERLIFKAKKINKDKEDQIYTDLKINYPEMFNSNENIVLRKSVDFPKTENILTLKPTQKVNSQTNSNIISTITPQQKKEYIENAKKIKDISNNLLKLKDQNHFLKQYVNKTYGFAVISASLTALAWAVAAFYTGAWFMFGANAVFAAAAAVQALVMTYFSYESFRTHYAAKAAQEEIDDFLSSNERIEIEQLIKKVDINILNFDKILEIYYKPFVFNAILSKWKFIMNGLKELTATIIMKYGTRIFNNLLIYKPMSNLIKLMTNLSKSFSAKKIVLLSTGWANPISSFISKLDIIITLTDFGLDLAYLSVGSR